MENNSHQIAVKRVMSESQAVYLKEDINPLALDINKVIATYNDYAMKINALHSQGYCDVEYPVIKLELEPFDRTTHQQKVDLLVKYPSITESANKKFDSTNLEEEYKAACIRTPEVKVLYDVQRKELLGNTKPMQEINEEEYAILNSNESPKRYKDFILDKYSVRRYNYYMSKQLDTTTNKERYYIVS